MFFPSLRKFLLRLAALALCAAALGGAAVSAQQQTPLTNAEFLALVRQLPYRPEVRGQLVEEIRKRGIGFSLNSGLRSFVATKSGNDEELRRVIEEAERRFLNPEEATPLPSEAETTELLARTRAATLEAVAQMPDFVVKQLVTRAWARGESRNWRVDDRLVVGVSYRVSEGEKYRLLAVNGAPSAGEEKKDYTETGGATSTGEFVTALKALFEEKSKTQFKPLDTDTLRGRRAVVYAYEIKKANSGWLLDAGEGKSVISAHRGKVWVDRERARVLRVETEAYGIPASFPITGAQQSIDYDWVAIPGQGDYLLPSRSVAVLTRLSRGESVQFRNDISFRNYQKYGTELKILDEDIIDEEVPAETTKPPKQPEQTKPPEPKL